jgi:hypothetical protein
MNERQRAACDATGRKHSPETKEKMRLAHTGVVFSEKRRASIWAGRRRVAAERAVSEER